MTAKEYLLKIGFDDAHLCELFNNDDKSYYQIAELMEEYHEAKLKSLGKNQLLKELERLKNESGTYSNNNSINTGYYTAILDAIDLVKKLTLPDCAKDLLSYENIKKMANEYTGGEEDYKAFILACNVIAEKLEL